MPVAFPADWLTPSPSWARELFDREAVPQSSAASRKRKGWCRSLLAAGFPLHHSLFHPGLQSSDLPSGSCDYREALQVRPPYSDGSRPNPNSDRPPLGWLLSRVPTRPLGGLDFCAILWIRKSASPDGNRVSRPDWAPTDFPFPSPGLTGPVRAVRFALDLGRLFLAVQSMTPPCVLDDRQRWLPRQVPTVSGGENRNPPFHARTFVRVRESSPLQSHRPAVR